MKQVLAWLRMVPVTGEYAVPTSEADYSAHVDLIDIAAPTHGGKLQADGTWLQETWKLNPAWSQVLPSQARNEGQKYIPTVSNDIAGILTVLDSPALQETAADGLVALATTGRFDSPWDGVAVDLEGIPSTYKTKLSTFYQLLSEHLRAANVPVLISVRGIASDPGPDYDSAYSQDFSVIAAAADFVDLRCYGYWNPLPRSTAPHWWIEACIQFALGQGVSADQIMLGLGNFARYFPDSEQPWTFYEVTHEKARALIQGAYSSSEWIEANGNGTVREWYSVVGSGHLWLHDGATLKYGLDLIDKYNLRGLSLFIPGMGNGSEWQAIGKWNMAAKGWVTPEVLNYKPGQRPAQQRPAPPKRR